ncbi:aldehyde dehydrogenase family protein [Bradyrhizobium vignae]|uniref:aldehyde dehydrogenase family protein n=1 Tax=Bradyrhizobium vignae TaxID=1549949 RepID=UPI00100BBC51|nr:aldehyde dehydrogenase family protein [Bradyrhizobium vignae]RXH06651.1 aldehyde dehydrogenase family protein [Bradyrhizobium vignae]
MSEFRLLIDGKMVPGDLSMNVVNPATEGIVASCPRASHRQLDSAVGAAKVAFPLWSSTPIERRREVLMRIADVIDQNAEMLARILTQEQGKPFPDSMQEIRGAAGLFRRIAPMELPMKLLEESESRRVEAHRRPLGVVAAIVPWNFPIALLAFKMPPALLAGNTIVVKPAATTPLSTLKLGELICDVVPAGVINVIADANDLGGALSAHPDVRKVSFTGSTATGKKVMASAADTLKRVTLELGGNDAAIVLDDVDPKAAAPKIFQQAFRNSGQICVAVKRVYAHEAVYDELCDELAKLADAAVVGDGLQQGVQIGPVQNKVQFERVQELLEDARLHGKVIAGGTITEGPGYFVRPTIIRDIEDGVRIVDEEQFGPVLPVMKFTDLDDAIQRANNSPWGLGGSVWSRDERRAVEVGSRIESGTVWINSHGSLAPHIPFGGSKQSGMGIEFGEEGLAEFTQLQVISVAR